MPDGSGARLVLTREQILAHRRRVSALHERLPFGPDSLRTAAWAGLSDSMPRGASLSIHARVEGTDPTTWEHPSLAQVWGPRFSAYVVAAADVPVFTLGRLPPDGPGRRRADAIAKRLTEFLGDRRIPYGQAGHDLGVNPNELRYATTTGTVRIRWDGARQPTIWTVPAPDMDAGEARLELARRHLRVFGPTTPAAFSDWAGIKPPRASNAFAALSAETLAVRTPMGDAWILTADEASFRGPPQPAAAARLLPSGDTWFLLQSADRELLVPHPRLRAMLWTPRVWPGAVLVDGEIVGTWRRAHAELSIEPWRALSAAEREAVEGEAASLPLPALSGTVRVRWRG